MNEVVLIFPTINDGDENDQFPGTQIYRVDFEGSAEDFMRAFANDAPGLTVNVLHVEQLTANSGLFDVDATS